MEAKKEETHPGSGPRLSPLTESHRRTQGCEHARVLPGCHWSGVGAGRSQRPVFFRAERLTLRRKGLFGGKPLSGDSADLIREAREIRDVEIKEWA